MGGHFLNMIFLLAALLPGIGVARAEMSYPQSGPPLEVIAELDERPGNVAVALDGRVFITMHPAESHRCKLYEIQAKGKLSPYPNEKISCSPPDAEGSGFYKPLGVRSTVRYQLLVLDMGEGDVPPRLLVINHSDNAVKAIYKIPRTALTDQSFLQDLGLNWTSNVVYLADMGQAEAMADKDVIAKPGFLLLFPNPLREPVGRLYGHPTLHGKTEMQAEGREMLRIRNGKPEPVRLALNPMTIDVQRNWLYYGPMSAGKIYRVPLDKMEDVQAVSDNDLARIIEDYADKPPSDGITIDAAGNLYLTNVRDGEIGVIDPKTRQYRTYLKDERLLWPDGLSFGPDGMLYVTINQLNRAAPFNLGKEEGKKPYLVARFKPLTPGAVGR